MIGCDRVKSKMAVGYEPDGSVAPLYDFGWKGPGDQMYSTINDLNKVLITTKYACVLSLVLCNVMCYVQNTICEPVSTEIFVSAKVLCA